MKDNNISSSASADKPSENNEPTEKNKDQESESSSESLYEIRLNECVKKSEISDFDVRALVVRCSSCGRQINHYIKKEVRRHRKLNVITCKECYEFYGSSEFSQDDNGYNYCTWCGNGGKLIVCDYCPNGFCSACIRRNFGRSEISVTCEEGWKCYICDKTRLKPKIKFCDLIVRCNESLKKEKNVPKDKKTKVLSDPWLQAVFDESEEACKKFHRKMNKLKTIGLTKSKSLKHVVKKIEEIINNHKTDLKSISNSFTKTFETRREKQWKEESNDKHDSDNSDIMIIENPSKSQKEASQETVEIFTDSLTADVNPDKNEDSVDDEKLKMKRKLLDSSSESDDNKLESLVSEENKMEADNSGDEQVDNPDRVEAEKDDDDDIEMLGSNIPDKENGSKISYDEKESNASDKEKRKKEFNNEKVTKKSVDHPSGSKSLTAKRKLFTFSPESSDSDFHVTKPFIEEIDFEGNSSPESIEKDNDKCSAKDLGPELDEKLKKEIKIDITRCDKLLKDGESFVKISDKESSDAEEKLDRLIDNLCKKPSIKIKSSSSDLKRKPGPKSRAAAKRELLESSSSISLSSEEDEDQKKIVITKKGAERESLPKKKGPLDSSDDSSSSFDSDDEVDDVEDKKEKKKSKPKPGKKESDSSDDFVPTRKRKYDKLLHGPIFSDEEKTSKEKKETKSSKKRKVLLSSEDEKKEKKNKDSDTSSTTSSSDDDSREKQPKKRRRVKRLGSSSEDNEDQDKDTPGKGRKNIRKIISQKKIASTTKEAQLEEKERRRRIFERQKLYNKIEDLTEDGKHVITRKMVLEVDQDSKEEIVEIHPDLVCKLKPHQVNGVKFMWECTIESVKDLDKPGTGCILAHCMGLGKTLQVIAFLHTCLKNKIVGEAITTAMIICPLNTTLNWASEFDYWLNEVENEIKVHQLTQVKSNMERLDILEYWYKEGGVIILSYDMFRRLAQDKIPKFKVKDRKKMQEYLLDPGPDIVVCDEGHVLKNDKSAISVATAKLRTRRRIVLTGTPLQNNLREYHCMLSFVKPNLLGTNKEFRNRFVNPIINGQYDDSNLYDVKLMKKRIHILHKLLEGCVQRCDYSALTKFLPPKHEFVISVKLSEVQMNMYECYLEKIKGAKSDAKNAGSTLFIDFNNLRCIWTHPFICRTSHERAEFKKMFKDDEEEEEAFIDDGTEESASSTPSDTSDDDKLIDKIKGDNKRKDYRTRSKVQEMGESEEEEENSEERRKQWFDEFISEEDKYNVELSGKIVLLLEILKECELIRDKVLLFSQSLLALDAVEDILNYTSNHNLSEEEGNKDRIGTWVKGIDYFRMDGSTSAEFRKSYIDLFNDPSNERARLFLISTRAGSLGTNLVGANRVVIFDTSWNPSHDVQAIFRVYRFGQLKPVYIYRLLAQGTMEEKIYDRQVTKLSLSCRVVDEQQIDRHFSAADLAELYMFDRNSTSNRPTPMLPKDRLLAELLIRSKEWIVTYHEHDSLLQNQTEEDLTEEERQAAWTEYENEREGKSLAATAAAELTQMDNLTNPPDFSQDYEGKTVPDLKSIIENIADRMKKQHPTMNDQLQFQKMLVSNLRLVRQAFQERHVEVLRQKQELCTTGTVPSSLNKYLDEVSQLLNSSSDYMNKLMVNINNEEMKRRQAQIQFQARMQQQFRGQNRQAQAQAQYIQQMQNAMRMRMGMQRQGNNIRAQVRPQYFNMAGGVPRAFTVKPPVRTYAGTHVPKHPVVTITEVDDNDPVPSATTSNGPKKSTVVIEEIL